MADEKPGVQGPYRGADNALTHIRSTLSSVPWPPMVSGRAAILASYLHQLDHSQWLDAATLAQRQHAALVRLAYHAIRHSTYFHSRMQRAGLVPEYLATPAGLARLAPLTRRDIQTAGETLYCREVPDGHMPLGESRTSGSTGEPVITRRTQVTQLIWHAMTMRYHFWHSRDFSAPMAAIRANIKETTRLSDWRAPASLLFDTGPSLGLSNAMDLQSIAEVLMDFKPHVLLAYPTSLAGLTGHCRAAGITLPSLKHIHTMGETLSQHVRDEATAYWGATVEDTYSSNELGYIALQCPVSGLYHAMAESHLVEVLDENGAPCREGEVGRVVVSDLHNFATPMLRYEIGDFAEVAGPCACGRGLNPTFKRIVGRERNLVLMPDGTRHWPHFGFRHFREITPISQYQFIQTGREEMEVRLVAERPVTPAEEDALRVVINRGLGFAFRLQFTYWQGRLPPDASGKFEEFVCRVTLPG
jgi:phenylacetate-CoA ligase